MSVLTRRVVLYAAQECTWQRSGEMSVANMVDGWLYAHRHKTRPVTLRHVLALGRIIEPQKNQAGLRRVGVRVGWDVKLHEDLVPDALDRLILTQPGIGRARHLTSHWFRNYEEIHPFVDGNGRTGSLLFNWLRGSLDNPIHPPNFWYDRRRDVRGYPDPAKITEVQG